MKRGGSFGGRLALALVGAIVTPIVAYILETINPLEGAAPAGGDPAAGVVETAPPFGQVAHNGDWTPVIRDFGGVEMVQVPPGCFRMGSTSQRDQRPVHQVCFYAPFWIDRYEITETQYGSAPLSAARAPVARMPRVWLRWMDVYEHCEKRGARLPTEAEWEYAARGPDSLTYPWGNDFNGTRLVYLERTPGLVGSKNNGASWVGALDMAGNVSEWVNSAYLPYPFSVSDGREGSTNNYPQRVQRGGSFDYGASETFTTFYRREGHYAGNQVNTGGRCALSA
jgi:formylglycine-generating enzyme required for sulfatase activity